MARAGTEERAESQAIAWLCPGSKDGSSACLRPHPHPLLLLKLEQMRFSTLKAKDTPQEVRWTVHLWCGLCHHHAAASRARTDQPQEGGLDGGGPGPWACYEMQLAPEVIYNDCLPFGEGRTGRIVFTSKVLHRLRKYTPRPGRDGIFLGQKNKDK